MVDSSPLTESTDASMAAAPENTKDNDNNNNKEEEKKVGKQQPSSGGGASPSASDDAGEAPNSTPPTTTPSTSTAEDELVELATSFSPSLTTTTSTTTATTTQHEQEQLVVVSTNNSTMSTQPSAPPQETSSALTSLAFCSSTPLLAKFLLPILCLATHALFYYGQTAPMWKLRAYANVSVWANATDWTAKRAFDTVGLDYDQPIEYLEEEDVQTFTYYFAIQHLWEAKGLPSVTLPRIAAALLIVFSGIWPHLKLLWLNLTWFFGKAPIRRTRTLHWLSTLGKWSLADVLVVCVMVGVLHLDWIVEPDDIKQGVIDDMPALLEIVQSMYTSESLCDKFLKMTCDDQKRIDNKVKCKACRGLINEAFSRPSWTQSTGRAIMDGVDTSGGGLATLRVVGMRGIYAFSGAVIISILLSLIVDIFDHRAKVHAKKLSQREVGRRRLERVMMRQQQQQQQLGGEGDFEDPLQEPLLLSNGDNDDGYNNTNGPSPLEVDSGSEDVGEIPSSQHAKMPLFSCFFILMGFVTTAFVYMGIELDSMERQVHGAGPMLLHDILGVNWNTEYSLRSLMWTTGAAGSWDYLLMATFGLFIVLGPAIRTVLLNSVTLLDRCRVPVSCLSVLINFVGAFCSWEVFAIAIVMVQMLMPTITNTILPPHKNKWCGQVSDDGSCLQVEFNILPNNFATIIIGGLLLVIMSWQAFNRSTDRGVGSSSSSSSPNTPSRIMPANHNYQGLQLVGQQTSEDEGDGAELEEVVFETQNV